MSMNRFSEGVSFLEENGYNIYSATASGTLPEPVVEYLNGRNVDLEKYKTLVLIGSGGLRLWEAIHERGTYGNPRGCRRVPLDPEHPVNSFTAHILKRFVDDYLDGDNIITLFPSQPPRFSIQKYAHWLGIAHPTPLGKNIHKEFGLWHAYRAAFLTTHALPETSREPYPAPCESCIEKPCIKVCPSQAVGEVVDTLSDFNRKKCFTYRLSEKSVCSDRCISRIACPIAREHKYTMPQMNHHYSCSRRKIIEKYNTNNQYGYVAVSG